jgi:pyruvate-formate lyase-activating enzyme
MEEHDDNGLGRYRAASQAMFDELSAGPSEAPESAPLDAFIEPCNACNLDCPFCPTSQLVRRKSFMTLERFHEVLERLEEADFHPRLTLTGQGEPFLNEDLEEMVAEAKRRGFHVALITNGTMTTPERAARLIESGLNRIQFSFDSVDPEVYAAMRVQKGSGDKQYFLRALRNILAFSRLNHEAGRPVFISVMSVQTERNRHLAEEFQRFWSRYPVDHVFLAPLSTLQGNSVDPEAIAAHYQGDMADKPLCLIPWTTLSFKVDGSVVACSHDYENRWPLGKVEEQPLRDLWTGERARKLRRGLIDGEVDEFVAAEHDCKVCNNPLIGYSVGEFLEGHQHRLARLEGSFRSSAPPDPERYRAAMEELERLSTPKVAV